VSSETGAARFGVMLVTEDDSLAELVREILATTLPSASMAVVPLATAPASDADAAIVDQTVRGLTGVTALQELRARGFHGGLVLLASACDSGIEHRLLALGPARCVARGEMTLALPAALAELAARPELGADLGPIQHELRRTQQLIAMGEATSRIQHTLNNPLTALLAEAQLLEMEETLSDEHRGAVKRIIELCRRLVVMVRALDSGTG
jgi:signal transduction histidine kinase